MIEDNENISTSGDKGINAESGGNPISESTEKAGSRKKEKRNPGLVDAYSCSSTCGFFRSYLRGTKDDSPRYFDGTHAD